MVNPTYGNLSQLISSLSEKEVVTSEGLGKQSEATQRTPQDIEKDVNEELASSHSKTRKLVSISLIRGDHVVTWAAVKSLALLAASYAIYKIAQASVLGVAYPTLPFIILGLGSFFASASFSLALRRYSQLTS